MSPTSLTLNQLLSGEMAVVVAIDADQVDAARIKRMGICEGRRIQMVKAGDPMILRVVGTRVGLSALLAPQIQVRHCGADDSPVEVEAS